ncbi:MAG: 30S ribosome-binding factor RbfA [Candidatus Manganitrophaceae bacterium]
MQQYKRTDRIGDRIKAEVADILTQKVRDPRIGFVTVTGVEVSDDLQHAKIFVAIQEGLHLKQTFAGLRKATAFIRLELAKRLELRRVPELIFLPDESGEKISHLMDLLDHIEKEK